MEDATQKYVDDMRDLFLTEGWAWVETECKDMLQQYSDIDGLSTIEQLMFAKGVRYASSQIIALPDMIKDLEEEADEDD